jgi:hypothetical protein
MESVESTLRKEPQWNVHEQGFQPHVRNGDRSAPTLPHTNQQARQSASLSAIDRLSTAKSPGLRAKDSVNSTG